MLRAPTIGFVPGFKKLCKYFISNKDKKGLDLYLDSLTPIKHYLNDIHNDIIEWFQTAINDYNIKDINFILKYGLINRLPCPSYKIINTAIYDINIWYILIKTECKNYYKNDWRLRHDYIYTRLDYIFDEEDDDIVDRLDDEMPNILLNIGIYSIEHTYRGLYCIDKIFI